jgi:hypothetical protein
MSKAEQASGSKAMVAVIVVLVVAALALGGYLLYRQKASNVVLTPSDVANLPPEEAQKKADSLEEKVRKLIQLPADDKPVVATISDVDTLKAQQQFYAAATNGDVLLIFPKSAKAVIYSPSNNVLVNVGPVIFDQNQQLPAGTTPQAN